jgi:hypothetical protein
MSRREGVVPLVVVGSPCYCDQFNWEYHKNTTTKKVKRMGLQSLLRYARFTLVYYFALDCCVACNGLVLNAHPQAKQCYMPISHAERILHAYFSLHAERILHAYFSLHAERILPQLCSSDSIDCMR